MSWADDCPRLVLGSHILDLTTARGGPPMSVSRLSGGWFMSPGRALKGRLISEKLLWPLVVMDLCAGVTGQARTATHPGLRNLVQYRDRLGRFPPACRLPSCHRSMPALRVLRHFGLRASPSYQVLPALVFVCPWREARPCSQLILRLDFTPPLPPTGPRGVQVPPGLTFSSSGQAVGSSGTAGQGSLVARTP